MLRIAKRQSTTRQTAMHKLLYTIEENRVLKHFQARIRAGCAGR
jgi:hypothetical protein